MADDKRDQFFCAHRLIEQFSRSLSFIFPQRCTLKGFGPPPAALIKCYVIPKPSGKQNKWVLDFFKCERKKISIYYKQCSTLKPEKDRKIQNAAATCKHDYTPCVSRFEHVGTTGLFPAPERPDICRWTFHLKLLTGMQ